jgi:RNA polymerase sigma factor (sigma-70 family)
MLKQEPTVELYVSLVARAQSGDLEAFGRLVRCFQDMAYGYAYSILRDFALAEDATQEAFLHAYHKLSDLRAPEAFPGWFRRIVFKYCDRQTRRKRVPVVPLDVVGDLPSGGASPETVVVKREAQDEVLAMIEALPENERIATTLFYMDGYSQKEIAAFLGVPVTTVKNRLYAARKRLRERSMDVIQEALQNRTLPEDFAQRLLMYPFPRQEPPVEVVDLERSPASWRCLDAQSHFVPLVENGKCDWTFYDWPGGRLTGVYECHIVSSAGWKGGTLLREWTRFTDLQDEGKQSWEEQYILVEDGTCRWVDVRRGQLGELALSAHRYANGQLSEPTPMHLQVGMTWGESDKGQVVGASRVTVGERSWHCLKVAYLSDQGGGGRLLTLAEWYVADTGRTVLFRRYNAPGWREPDRLGSFESLAGSREVTLGGIRFRHWYDCIPDHALDAALG